jgi:hypothetical protein
MPGPAFLGSAVAHAGLVDYALSDNAPAMIASCVKRQHVSIGAAEACIRGGAGACAPARRASECADSTTVARTRGVWWYHECRDGHRPWPEPGKWERNDGMDDLTPDDRVRSDRGVRERVAAR